jgi:ABC-type uncharacterized transport system involved in gliding motility auxiliary subunit
MPGREFPETGLGTHMMAVQVAPRDTADTTARGRIIVVGNQTFAADRFAQQAPENFAFVLNAVDWLAQDEALIRIRAKDPRPPSLAFSSSTMRDGVKHANMIILPLAIALGGFLRITKRRRSTRDDPRPPVESAVEEKAATEQEEIVS